jgi:hypothetical protein
MNTLQAHYQAVIDDVAANMQKDVELQQYHDWLVCRKDTLNERRDRAISGFKNSLEAYLRLCERFWKERHERTYEKKMDELFEVKKRVIRIYSLSGFDACYALMLAIKPMRSVLPLTHYDEHLPALAALEAIKDECYRQLGTYIKV